jgi:uncharacterized membrane protein YbhN (UPF0104 family)
MKQRLRDWLIGGVLLLGLVAWVQYAIGWPELLAPWRQVAPGQLLYLFALSLLSYVLRGVRIYDYFPELMRGRLPSAVRLSVLHNVANNLLPMRSGEAFFPLLMKRYFGHGLADSTFSLIWIRLFDLHVIGLVALVAGWLALPHWLWVLGLAAAIVALPLVLWLSPRLQVWLSERPGKLAALVKRILGAMPGSVGRMLRVYLWTLLSWAAKFLAFTVVLLHFLDAEHWQAFTGIIGAELSSVLPFHGVAGSGSYELAAVAALVPTGIDADAALRGAVNLHFFLLGVTLALWPLALLLPKADRMADDEVYTRRGASDN